MTSGLWRPKMLKYKPIQQVEGGLRGGGWLERRVRPIGATCGSI